MRWAMGVGPLLALVVGGAVWGAGLGAAAAWTAGITALCALWWVTEPIPVVATSLLPLAIFPFAGVLDEKQVGAAYGNPVILLLMGGFMLSSALEQSGAHRRLAMGMVRLLGGQGGRRLLLGVLLTTACISMWISNAATTLMMVPVALALVEQDREQSAGRSTLAFPLLAGIAWAANIGGLGTPLGTPPNLIFMAAYKELTGQAYSFAEWMKVGVPAVLLLVPVAVLILGRGLPAAVPMRLPDLGPWRPAERRTLAIFGLTALAWVFRSEPFGGWSGLLGLEKVGDTAVALLSVCALFLVPSGEPAPVRAADPTREEREPAWPALLSWERAAAIPWGLLLLFGGGLSIAAAFESSGLAGAFGRLLAEDLGIASWPPLLTAALVCTATIFVTEIMSNTALTTLLMPVLAAAATAAGMEPAALMVPAAMSASCGFMMPVGTAPNAIVYGTGLVQMREMVRWGLVLNLASALILTALCTWLLG